jgi:hypothetical protein
MRPEELEEMRRLPLFDGVNGGAKGSQDGVGIGSH